MAANLAWLVEDRSIEPHIPMFDKSACNDNSFERADFVYDHDDDTATSAPVVVATSAHLAAASIRTAKSATVRDGQSAKTTPSNSDARPTKPTRKVIHLLHEDERDLARDIARIDADFVSRPPAEEGWGLFAHLMRILKLDRSHLRTLNGAKDEFQLATSAHNLRKLAKMPPMPSHAPV